jgi:hypothetical protein
VPGLGNGLGPAELMLDARDAGIYFYPKNTIVSLFFTIPFDIYLLLLWTFP